MDMAFPTVARWAPRRVPMSDVTVVGSSRPALPGKLGIETRPAVAGPDAEASRRAQGSAPRATRR